MLDTKTLLTRTDGLVSEKTQHGPAGLELTVQKLLRLSGGGALDFGGSEYRAAEAVEVACTKGAEDKYGWWRLETGRYQVLFNERVALKEGEHALLTPHPRLLLAGGSHAAFVLGPDEPLFAVLEVGESGLALKENCRISRLNVVP